MQRVTKAETYAQEVDIRNTHKLRDLQSKSLPHFLRQFFRGIAENTSTRTRLAYAYDLRVFFEYIHNTHPIYSQMEITEFPLEILNELQKVDLEDYMEYLSYYEKDGKQYTNDERGKARKLSALRSMYKYFYTTEMIERDTAVLLHSPKLHEKAIVRLDNEEVGALLDEVEAGSRLTTSQQRFHEKTKVRDVAILTLLLGTGMRVSECVGIDIGDLNFRENGVKVHRKGGYDSVVYFNDEVAAALKEYLNERRQIIPADGEDVNALFLSLQRRRISVRAVEQLVKKYAGLVTNLKKITPHKLRSTFGTALYRHTGDIYLVADVLGHKDVNTTRKHYAAIEEDRRRQAAQYVSLRGDDVDLRGDGIGNGDEQDAAGHVAEGHP